VNRTEEMLLLLHFHNFIDYCTRHVTYELFNLSSLHFNNRKYKHKNHDSFLLENPQQKNITCQSTHRNVKRQQKQILTHEAFCCFIFALVDFISESESEIVYLHFFSALATESFVRANYATCDPKRRKFYFSHCPS
jgi:hypothetical protein